MRKKRHITGQIAVVLVIFSTIVSCSTKKKSREELSLLGKAYHNTTALYNGYFNANEIMEATYVQLNEAHKDNYTELLPIFPHEQGNADNVKAELDRAIEKVSIVATVHKPSKWRDDCYVLLCEAQYLQQDYETAEESLRFTVSEFDPLSAKNKKKSKRKKKEKKSTKEINKERKEKNKDRKKSKSGKKRKRMTREEKAKAEQKAKKEAQEAKLKELAEAAKEREERNKVDKEDGFLQHRPVFQDACLWLAKTYIKRDKFSLADTYLRRLEENPGLHDEVREELYPTRALYYIEQDRADQAEAPLEQAFIYAPDRQSKARYAYILGQIKEQKSKFAEAEFYFDEVEDLRPSFDMIFNAQLRKALNGKRANKIDNVAFQKEMDKMLKDDKYDDYQDQIYTALAEMSFDEGNREEGMAQLRKALGKGDKKSVYKTEAYYKIAEYFFKEENFVDAKLYYDSTLLAMPKDDDRRPEVEKLSTSLTEIAAQIQIIALQDSLIKLSKLPREELVARAEKMQEEEEAQKEATDAPQSVTFNPVNSRGVGKSNFFAYDALSRDKGKRDFNKKWGDRKLEDHWRRKNKSSSTFDEEDEEEVVASDKSDDEQLIEKYFSSVPFEEEDMTLALKTKEAALFSLGKLYRDNMQNCKGSTETLGELLADYPTTEKRPDALFYLYLCALDDGDQIAAEKYAKELNDSYPTTLYAKSINDPDFLKKEQDKKAQLDKYYQETYSLFSEGEYALVEQRLTEVDNLFKSTSNLTAKFALLGAMMAGQQAGKEAYINGLRDVIAKHKETPEATRAREIMRFLQGDQEAFKNSGNEPIATGPFKMEENKLHYVCVVVFDMAKSNLNETKVSISSYNRRFHKKEKLNLSTLDLDIENSTPLILVRKFKTKEDAMSYYSDVMRRKDKFITKDIQYDVYAISQRNYREVIKAKSVADYRVWFNQNYLIDEE